MSNKNYVFLDVSHSNNLSNKNIYAFNKGVGGPHPPLILKRFLLYLLLYLLLYFFICLHLLLQICLLLLCLLRDFLFEPNKEPTKLLKEKEPDAIIQ
jgi:hypothetical protein